MAVATGAHYPGDQVKGLKAIFLHGKNSLPVGQQIDLAFPWGRVKDNTLPGHGRGEGQRGFIFVDPFGAHLVFFRDIEVLAAHLL